MNPSIWIYGGVHHDPGSRQKFVDELAKQEMPPHFVAVEWEQSVFERFVELRPQVAEGLKSRWDFLTREDCHKLSLGLAWDGDAYAERFVDADVLWLESGFQEAKLKDKQLQSYADSLLRRLSDPCYPTMSEYFANIAPPPEPSSKEELIDRVWRTAWLAASGWPEEGFERDARWANAICERGASLRGGWIAVVVGWAHANPAGNSQRLRSLLSSNGFHVISVSLAPENL